MFETERLILRGWRPSDMDDLVLMLSDYDVLAPIQPSYIVPGVPEARKIIEYWISRTLFVIVEDKESSGLVGMAMLKIDIPKDADGEVGICLGKKWWGRGLGTEVMQWIVGYGFKGMALRRVSLCVFGFNERAIELYKRIGFAVEGVKREALWFEGKAVDTIWMGILKREYEERYGIS